MKSLYAGSGIHEATLRTVMADYPDFGTLFRDLPAAKAKAGSSPDAFEKLFLDNLAELLATQVPNQFRILYRGKELRHRGAILMALLLMAVPLLYGLVTFAARSTSPLPWLEPAKSGTTVVLAQGEKDERSRLLLAGRALFLASHGLTCLGNGVHFRTCFRFRRSCKKGRIETRKSS